MTAATRTTGAVTALLVLLGLGLFGQAGWLAALVLAALAGVLLAALLHWLVDQGPAPMDGTAFAPPVVQVAEPAAAAAPAVPEVPQDDLLQDDLRAIRGIGPKVAEGLNQAGVTRLDQIAAWDDAQIDRIAVEIGRGAARIRNDDWVGQARALIADRAGA